jgi:ATP-dependent DNA helicase RecQ
LSELRRVSGFGDAKIEKYGQQFLDIILNYCKTNQLSSLIHNKTPKRERKEKSGEKKPDTKSETFNLYKNGKSVADIAKERSLTTQTIEGHLSHYVRTGEIEIRKLVSEEKIFLIEPHVKNFGGGSITPIKEKLGNGVSFGEIRLVLAWLSFKQSYSG